MNSRDRFICAARRGKPDRVPIFAHVTPQVAEALGKKFGLPYEPEDSFLSTRISHNEILLKLGNDAVGVGPCRETPTRVLEDGKLMDEWGIVYNRVGLYDEAVLRPLGDVETLDDLEKYRFPDPLAEHRFELAKRVIETYGEDYAIVGDLEATIFELAWNLVGLDRFLMDLFDEKAYVYSLVRKIAQFNKAIAIRLVELGCDMVWLGDDFGTQRGMMISPQMYRTVFKPLQADIIEGMKNVNPEIIVAYHSCGAIGPIIDDLIEIGVDVLNPIQPQAEGMDLGELKKKYGDKLAFFGCIDVQGTLPHGTAHDVYEEIKELINKGGGDGGLILAPAHNIQPDTPLENIVAMYDAVRRYG